MHKYIIILGLIISGGLIMLLGNTHFNECNTNTKDCKLTFSEPPYWKQSLIMLGITTLMIIWIVRNDG